MVWPMKRFEEGLDIGRRNRTGLQVNYSLFFGRMRDVFFLGSSEPFFDGLLARAKPATQKDLRTFAHRARKLWCKLKSRNVGSAGPL